jgi:glutamate synthase (NADPH/NADH) large chain
VSNVTKASAGVLKVRARWAFQRWRPTPGLRSEALGLSREVVDRYFTGTTSKLGGVTSGRSGSEVGGI